MVRRVATVAALVALDLTLVAASVSPAAARGDAGELAPEPALAAQVGEVTRLSSPPPLPADRAPRITFAGDSVATTVAPAFAAEASGRGAQVSSITRPGCGMLDGVPTTLDGFTPPWAPACAAYAPTWRGQVARAGGDVVVVLSTWDGSSRLADGVLVDPGSSAGRATTVELYRRLVEDVAPAGSGRRVVFLAEAIPAPGATTGDASPTRIAEARQHRATLRALARAEPDRVRVIDLGQWLCPLGPQCPATVDGVQVRADDGGHFTPDGAAWLAPKLADALGL